MDTTKRKRAPEAVSKPNKKPRPDKTIQTKVMASSGKENTEPEPKRKKSEPRSVLKKEQQPFPRGGAGLLTPIERKQINAKAVQDAIAEHKGDLFTNGVRPDADSNDEGGAGDQAAEGPSQKTKKKKVKKSKHARDDASLSIRPKKIAGLTFKRIAVGSLILGQIISISERDLTVALPNNLVGYVPLTAISSQLSSKIQALLEHDSSESESDEPNDQEQGIELQTYLHIGQFLRVCVTSTGQESDIPGKSSRKRLELSIHPSSVNTGLNKFSLAAGTVVQVSIASVEDHGLLADLELEDYSARGFIPTSALPTSVESSQIKEGAVLLCQVTEFKPKSKVLKLSADLSNQTVLKSAPSVDSFLPGTFAEILITELQESAALGKVMGMLDASVDSVHSQAVQDKESFDRKFKVGKKIKARITCNYPTSEDALVGFSVLDHVLRLDGQESNIKLKSARLSSIVKDAKVTKVEAKLGVYLDLGADGSAFAHVSRLADAKVESLSELSGPYKVGTLHKARILDYNPVDDLFIVSLQQSIFEQPFLRVEDVSVGEVVKGKIARVLIGANGIKGLIIDLADNVTGFVHETHLSDVVLQHPEKKFREGSSVKARVLYTLPAKRQIRLTLKKTLVNSDAKLWKSYEDIEVGNSSLGTLVKVDATGALVHFFGFVKGYLPVSEMSEAYIKDARDHFRAGQVLTVNAISVDAKESRLTLSCRDSKTLSQSAESTLAAIKAGSLTSGVVFEKSQDDVQLRLDGSDAIARLSIDHVADGSPKKRQSALSKLRVGQKVEDLLVLDVQSKRRLVILSNKPGLILAAKKGQLLTGFEELKTGSKYTGFVSNITSDGVFVSFASKISGLITPRNVLPGDEDKADFGMTKFQVVSATVTGIDYAGATPRFWLTLKDSTVKVDAVETTQAAPKTLENAIDTSLLSEADLVVGKITKARIISVKETQLNVELAKDVQGRVDVSEVFDRWEDIRDRKYPLKQFNAKQEIDVKVIGAHDTRTHRFLPLTHRAGKNTVYELTAKPSAIKSAKLTSPGFEDLKTGSSWIAFVNNIGQDCLWVNVSPALRGRIKAIDVSNDLSLASDLVSNFPLGSALRVRVLAADESKGRLDLTARSGEVSTSLKIQDISKGMVLPGRVTKVSDHQVVIQLSENLVGVVELIDIADDYAQADTSKYNKNDIVRACVVRVDASNKKINLSLRPSRVLSSSIAVEDPEINNVGQLQINDIYSGFIRNVDDKGIFVTLGHGITAFVRVSHLSDSYLKEWKDNFQRDQLVKGKIIAVDHASGHVQMSLKESVISKHYTPPLVFGDLKVGDIVTAKVAKVQDFGVFIVVDNSENVRGLCHRSEIAEQRVQDATKLFSEGDVVKAKVLKIDPTQRRINFGMKASYFEDTSDAGDEEMEDKAAESEADTDGSSSDGGAALEDSDDDAEEEQEIVLDAEDGEDLEIEKSDDEQMAETSTKPVSTGLKLGGFDWYGMSTNASSLKRGRELPDSDDEKTTAKQKKRKKRPEIQIDRTGDLDAHGPQSIDDYERLLLGEPDSSLLWLQYMAFHLELGDVDQAREIGKRALKSIGLGQDAEKMNVWVALLNLENAYGDDDSIEAMFNRACEFNDAEDMYTRLTSIYIQSGKKHKADDMFQRMLKKFTQDPKVWVNYGTFLFDTMGDAGRGRDVLPKALQVLPKFTHFDVTSKFAQLEFKSEAGLAERGRTIFEGLISSFPKRVDLYNILLDMEIKLGDSEQIRGLFERIFQGKLRPKQAKYFFKRWLAFEEGEGDERKIEDVKARAATWVRGATALAE
jgi:rRNA biogenesis protein RRP5